MMHQSPPRAFEALLRLLLPGRDRESISGDLLEEYSQERLPQLGRMRANLWYLRQCLSFISVGLGRGPAVKQALAGLCLFVMAASVWLLLMENILRHPGYAGRCVTDVCLAAQAVATFLCLVFHGRKVFRAIVLVCAAAIVIFGAFSVFHISQARHFEGYALLISVALIAQGALAFTTLLRTQKQPLA